MGRWHVDNLREGSFHRQYRERDEAPVAAEIEQHEATHEQPIPLWAGRVAIRLTLG